MSVPEEKAEWLKRHDQLQSDAAANHGIMPGPWNWEIHDASAATLCGGGEDAITGHIMTVGPCKACYANKDEWLWGRCTTPSLANARMIAAAPDMLAALLNVRKLISEAALAGFNYLDGNWPDRLFASQAVTSDAIRKATGSHRPDEKARD